MKVCMITPTFLPKIGGAEYQVKWLSEEVSKLGVEVFLITPWNSKEYVDETIQNKYFEELTNEAINFYFNNIKSLKREFRVDHIRNILLTYKYIKLINPDVIHLHFLYPYGTYLYLIRKLKMLNIPIISTSYGIDLIRDKNFREYYQNNRIKSSIIKKITETVDRVVVVSKIMKKDAIESGVPKDKITVIHNGYKPPNKITYGNIQSKYPLSPHDFIVIAIGRLHKSKGFLYLIKAFNAFLKMFDAKLVIVGDGAEKERLMTLARELRIPNNNIVFTGFVPDNIKFSLLKVSEIYCAPSIMVDALPISLFDPMYLGKPIISTDIGGIPEIIENNKSGILVRPKSEFDLLTAMAKLAESPNLKKKLGKNAQRKLNAEFMIDKIAKKYLSVYEEVV